MDSKSALLREVNRQTAALMVERLHEAGMQSVADDPAAVFMRMMHAYRAFAHENPVTYALAYANPSPETRPDADELEQLVIPLQSIVAAITGEADSLHALRGAWAMVHGFVMLELAGQFERAGSLDAAFARSVAAFVNGWKR